LLVGVILLREIRDVILQGAPHLAEPMHGCTCSVHAVSCAVGLWVREMLPQEDLMASCRAAGIAARRRGA
jgi:adenosylmethionine-8-amino-7-oxononanoate aminotransferase